MPAPRRIALTGGIATGKSYCLEQFRRLGADVIDADTLARDAVAAGTTGFDAVVARFGPGVLDLTGALDRAALAGLVFHDAAARRDLEAIVHPLVYERIAGWFQQLRPQAVGIADIPLLYETGRHADFDAVIVAACPPALQVERLMARGLTREDAELRLRAQMPVEDKVRQADHVIDTSTTHKETDRQVADVWAALNCEF